ncbi:Transthyretin-like family protein [Caenorhabditis elegans]|uniref:Transthyretin-like family protein n=1 Tax=Caenorhabditis elegans TaxID=6239 RepID=A7DT35_CAEEL|nr:Transthyretin-like family protein [Caenorhabditis elegans]CCD71983.2 Transthyretin-like family protein [Caenorhabditis elegans]|eukprot:NP_001021506.4 TransThyretin-Related family domain [Caenorhabditis elegans]
MKTIILIVLVIIWNTNAKEQSVRIKGRFTCHGLPAQYAEVQLVSKKIIGGDAFARDVFSDPSGAFEIAGYIDWSKYSKIDVRLYIWHNCFEKPYEQSDPCKNWFEFKVPNIFINDGTLAQKKWELGEVKLETPKYGKTLDACD